MNKEIELIERNIVPIDFWDDIRQAVRIKCKDKMWIWAQYQKDRLPIDLSRKIRSSFRKSILSSYETF